MANETVNDISIENEESENNLAIRIYYVAKYGLKSVKKSGNIE